MKTYEINFQPPFHEPITELNTYLHKQIENIGKEFSMIEKFEVELHELHDKEKS